MIPWRYCMFITHWIFLPDDIPNIPEAINFKISRNKKLNINWWGHRLSVKKGKIVIRAFSIFKNLENTFVNVWRCSKAIWLWKGGINITYILKLHQRFLTFHELALWLIARMKMIVSITMYTREAHHKTTHQAHRFNHCEKASKRLRTIEGSLSLVLKVKNRDSRLTVFW